MASAEVSGLVGAGNSVRDAMTDGLGTSGIARRVFAVGAIPIVVAAAIALGACILLYEAERARAGAVTATETAQTLAAMNRARADLVAAAPHGGPRPRAGSASGRRWPPPSSTAWRSSPAPPANPPSSRR